MARRRHRQATEECPHCGETFRSGLRACPHCGSDAETGWAAPEEIEYQSVEIPDWYEDEPPAPRLRLRHWLLALGLLLAGLALLRILAW